jgi:hypothetical protein
MSQTRERRTLASARQTRRKGMFFLRDKHVLFKRKHRMHRSSKGMSDTGVPSERAVWAAEVGECHETHFLYGPLSPMSGDQGKISRTDSGVVVSGRLRNAYHTTSVMQQQPSFALRIIEAEITPAGSCPFLEEYPCFRSGVSVEITKPVALSFSRTACFVRAKDNIDQTVLERTK